VLAAHATAGLELSSAERTLIRAVLALSGRNLTTNAETSACCARHHEQSRKIELNSSNIFLVKGQNCSSFYIRLGDYFLSQYFVPGY